MVPLTLGTFGRHGAEALQHLRRPARSHVENYENEEESNPAKSVLFPRWGAWPSVALHRSNAPKLRNARGSGKAVLRRSLAATLAA